MMRLDMNSMSRLIDVSVVRAEVDLIELEEMAQFVREHRFIGAHAMTCYVKKLSGMLADCPEVLVGGVVGFPFGSCRTEVKVLETKLAIEDGAREIDVVQNIGFLRSGLDDRVEADIHAVVAAAAPLPVKVILENAYLTSAEIVRGCLAAQRAGAHFVKTSTGHAPSMATPEDVALMKKTVGETMQIKAAGGIKSIDFLAALYRAGARRFGISVQFTRGIISEMEARGDAGYVI